MKKKETAEKKETENQKQLTKEQIAALKQEKKKAQEELDELRGRTTGGKIACLFAFLAIMLALAAGFVGLVKLNVGNFASDVLAPVIGDVPVVRSILPAEYQTKSASELQAEQDAAAAAEAQAQAEQAASEQAAAQAESEAAAEEEAIAQAESEQLAEEQASEQAEAETAQQAADEAALADYVDTYSKMKPKAAAQVFDNMMPDQSELVAKILSNMTPDQRATIISNMNVTNASELTVLMEQ